MHNGIEKICDKIDKIRNSIYDYDLKNVFTGLDDLILHILDYLNSEKLNEEKNIVFNAILENINSSIYNKDYMLLSDILKFQLRDYLEKL